MNEEIIDPAEDSETAPEPLPVFRYAHVLPDGMVWGVSLWDGVEPFTPPEDHTLHKVEDDNPVSPGWALRNGKWVDERPEPEPGDE